MFFDPKLKRTNIVFQSRIINKNDQRMQPYYFRTKQQIGIKRSVHQMTDQTEKYLHDLKEMILNWTQFQQKLTKKHQTQQFKDQEPDRFNNSQENHLQVLQNSHERHTQNPLSSQLIDYLSRNHSILKKINYNLVQTLVNIGRFTVYTKNEEIPFIYYDQKQKNKCNQKKRLGIIMHGRLKLYNKIDEFQNIADWTDSIGQHGMQTLGINFTDFRNVKVKSLEDQTIILWIKKQHYEILFKQSMQCGLKQQMKKLQAHLKLSWIKKSLKKF